jgi:PhoPQ-activated pathogenicity-related protein
VTFDRALLPVLLAALGLGFAPTAGPAQPAAPPAARPAAAPKADSPAPPSDLTDYVGKEDKSFAWKLVGKTVSDTGTVYELDLVSQTWHDIKWEHKVQVFVPKDAAPRATMMLWNQGGRPGAASGLFGLELAKRVGAPVAFLYGVPNQPLFGGKTEDTLIAETFVRFLETKDPTWPLLFPMVKSLVRAMDALQAFARQEWQLDVTGFVVTGASKRGWTSWLTAATGDRRVKAIAPLVIDTLNFPAQMRNQVAAFGRPSEMVRDYTNRNLIPIPETGEGRRLWTMVDPWVYRQRITVPRLIINGTNDPYWPLDALNSYWDDLTGEKYLLYVPNAGHDLREVDKNGKKELLPTRAVNALAAFTKAQVFGKAMPKLTWTAAINDPGHPAVQIESDTKMKGVRSWTASAPTRDFRKARWESTPSAGIITTKGEATFTPSEAGTLRAGLVEVDYELDGQPFTLTTQLRILDAKK